MPAPVQPASSLFAKASRIFERFFKKSSATSSKESFASGEETIRLAVGKWFGPLERPDASSRAGKNEHHETILETLLRLHSVSCSLVATGQRLPLPEQDILATIQILNYIAVTLNCSPRVIASRCAIRSLREQNLRANQLDPLQLRHLLTFHPDIRAVGEDTPNFETLKFACEKSDLPAIHRWFETTARNKKTVPKDTPQLLRQMSIDLWNHGHRDFFEAFATELAVLDARMFEVPGWENTRQFFVIFKRVHGTDCRFASSFLKPEDIALSIKQYKHLGDTAQTAHFQELSTTYDAPAFRHFERTVLAAVKEGNTRNPYETASASPFAIYRPGGTASPQGTPNIFARPTLGQSL